MATTKPNKLKNTGILFELLTRQVTNEVLTGKKQKARQLIETYFTNTELGKEYLLYNTLEKKKNLTESGAVQLFDTIEKLYEKLDHKKLESQKYSLIREIKQTYPNAEFFNSRIPQYRLFGSIQQWLTASKSTQFVHPDAIQKPRQTIFEHLTLPTESEVDTLNEYRNLTREDKYMVYKLMLENFNDTYSTKVSETQRGILSEYLLAMSNNEKLTRFVEQKQVVAKTLLTESKQKLGTGELATKLEQVIESIQPFKKGYVVRDSDVVTLLQHFELADELATLTK